MEDRLDVIADLFEQLLVDEVELVQLAEDVVLLGLLHPPCSIPAYFSSTKALEKKLIELVYIRTPNMMRMQANSFSTGSGMPYSCCSA